MSKPVMTVQQRRTRQYLDGVMAATVAVAQITSEQPIDGMTDRELNLIGRLNLRLIAMVKETAEEVARE